MKTPSHPWSFRQRLRTRAFGWRGSKLAIERLKEALGEVKTAARYDPETAAEGAILLMERLWPALQQVDSSSGALGTAANKTVHALLGVVLAAPAEVVLRELWLERLWENRRAATGGWSCPYSEKGRATGGPRFSVHPARRNPHRG